MRHGHGLLAQCGREMVGILATYTTDGETIDIVALVFKLVENGGLANQT